MKVITRPVSRWPQVPLWAIGFVFLWGAVIVASRIVSHYTGAAPDLCLFHRFTGLSCPTCGTTRGLFAVLRGEWLTALRWNPLTMLAGLIVGLGISARILTAKALVFEMTEREKRVLGYLGLALLGINWAWLIYSHP